MRAVFVTNVVSPYRATVLEQATKKFPGELTVFSCTGMEKGRYWQPTNREIDLKVLRGWQVRLFRHPSHINTEVVGALRSLDPDVIGVTAFTPTMLLAIAYAMARRKPYVIMQDGWLGADARPLTAVHRWIRRVVVPRSAAGIAPGRKSVEWFQHYGLDRDRVFVSPLVPTWESPPTIPGMQERAFDVLWCGHLEHVKGIDFFVEFVARLNAVRPGLRVRVVGDGPLSAWCRGALAERQVEASFDGFLQDEAVRAAFASARLFICPTRFDPWALVANEALLCGTPVLISPHAGAADEMVRDGKDGRVLELELEDWVQAARQLLDDPEAWQACSRQAVPHAGAVTVEDAAQAFINAFAHAAGGRGSARATGTEVAAQ